jgi:CheY-like chemotaxis protein
MVGLPDQPRLSEFGALQVKKVAASPTFKIDIDMHGADEIRVLQRGRHVLQMPRQPEIVISLIANDPPARLAKHAIAMDFTVTRPFREIEEPNAGVDRLQTLDGGTNRVVNAISDDEDFDVLDVLRLHARHCER